MLWLLITVFCYCFTQHWYKKLLIIKIWQSWEQHGLGTCKIYNFGTFCSNFVEYDCGRINNISYRVVCIHSLFLWKLKYNTIQFINFMDDMIRPAELDDRVYFCQTEKVFTRFCVEFDKNCLRSKRYAKRFSSGKPWFCDNQSIHINF